MYTDLNIIIPPFFHYIINLVFHIIGTNIVTFKIVGIINYCTMNLIIYNIFKTVKINKKNAISYIMIMQLTIYPLFLGSTNYNLLALTFVLFGVLLLIKYKSNYSWIMQGMISYIILFTKQNIGVYYLIAITLVEFITKGINLNTIKKLAKQMIITIVLLSFNLFLMYLEGNLYDFINYTILGIRDFTHNFWVGIDVILLVCIDIIILIVTIFMSKKKILEENKNEILYILAIYSIVLSLVIYPIVNTYHVKLAIIFPFITLIYLIHNLIFKEFNVNKVINIISIVIFCALFMFSTFCGSYWIRNAKFNLPYNHPYYGGVFEKETEEKIEKINEYILEQQKDGHNVIVLSKNAALYMLPLQKNNGIFDLPFIGNLGKEGEDGLIKKISELRSCKILISTEERFWQESQKAIDYVKQNYSKIDEIEEFEIYEIL